MKDNSRAVGGVNAGVFTEKIFINFSYPIWDHHRLLFSNADGSRWAGGTGDSKDKAGFTGIGGNLRRSFDYFSPNPRRD
jgi:hypothetical protein